MRSRLENSTPKKQRASSPRPFDELLKAPIKSKTLFPVLILHLLKRKPDHGYGLMTRIEDLCGSLLAVNTNKIYPLLRRLEERGFLTAKWDHPSKRSRRVYIVTAEGEARLNRIKSAMLPYLDAMSSAVKDLKKELYR